MKKIIEIFLYAVSSIVLIGALYADKAADNAMKQDLINRSGNPPSVTQKAPEFSIRQIGTDKTLQSEKLYDNSNIIVIISSPSCPFTFQLAENLLAELKNQNKSAKDVYLILDSVQTPLTAQEEKQWAEDYPDFNVYADIEASAAWGFKVQAYPTQYVISKNETILYRQSGNAGEKSLNLMLEKFVS